MIKAKKEEINSILDDLRALAVTEKNIYGIQENIRFFESLGNFFSYLYWLLNHGLGISRHKDLYEINELLPQYDERMHMGLVDVERRTFPGLIEPLVSKITSFINQSETPLRILNLGSGGMEIERQVIQRLVRSGFNGKVTFISIDRSLRAHEFARTNIAELNLNHKIKLIPHLDIKHFESTNEPGGISLIQCNNDIFSLDKIFPTGFFDLVYSSLFLHHLSSSERGHLEKILCKISKKRFAYDGYHSLFHIIPQSLISWSDPILCNASVFSGIRYLTKSEVRVNYFKPQFFSVQGTFLSETQTT